MPRGHEHYLIYSLRIYARFSGQAVVSVKRSTPPEIAASFLCKVLSFSSLVRRPGDNPISAARWLSAGDKRSQQCYLQVAIMRERQDLKLALDWTSTKKNELNAWTVIWLHAFGPSIIRNLITSILIFDHVKPAQSIALQQECRPSIYLSLIP